MHVCSLFTTIQSSLRSGWRFSSIQRKALARKGGFIATTCPRPGGERSQQLYFSASSHVRSPIAGALAKGSSKAAQAVEEAFGARKSLKDLSQEAKAAYASLYQIQDAIRSPVVKKERMLKSAESLLTSCLAFHDRAIAIHIIGETFKILETLRGKSDVNTLLQAAIASCKGGKISGVLENIRWLILMDKWPSSYLCHELLNIRVGPIPKNYGFNPGLMQVIDRPDSADLINALAAIHEAKTQNAWGRMEAVFKLIQACGHKPEKRTYQLLLT
jgi:hypothetical protein